jgi:hypothetical protein
LKKIQGGFLLFNNFLSTRKHGDVSLRFAERNTATANLVGVLFFMKIDLSKSINPFVDVQNVSYYQREEEILFSMHFIFCIGKMKLMDGNNRLWQVDLTLTSDNDP